MASDEKIGVKESIKAIEAEGGPVRKKLCCSCSSCEEDNVIAYGLEVSAWVRSVLHKEGKVFAVYPEVNDWCAYVHFFATPHHKSHHSTPYAATVEMLAAVAQRLKE